MVNQTIYKQMLLPAQCLGTFPMERKTLFQVVDSALSLGLYGFDSARDYWNEKDLGDAMKQASQKYHIKREQMFITTKIGNRQQINYRKGLDMLTDVLDSVRQLQSSYLDLLLMHWPYPDTFIHTWKQMEVLPQSSVRLIGVCNYQTRHLKQLLKVAEKKPILNQMEIHPLYVDWDTIDYCRENDIDVQAYCPLGLMDKEICDSSIMQLLCSKYNKSVAQIVLRWHLQHSFFTVSRSSSPLRIKQNADIYDFELTASEVLKIDGMNLRRKKYFESFYCPGY